MFNSIRKDLIFQTKRESDLICAGLLDFILIGTITHFPKIFAISQNLQMISCPCEKNALKTLLNL